MRADEWADTRVLIQQPPHREADRFGLVALSELVSRLLDQGNDIGRLIVTTLAIRMTVHE